MLESPAVHVIRGKTYLVPKEDVEAFLRYACPLADEVAKRTPSQTLRALFWSETLADYAEENWGKFIDSGFMSDELGLIG